MPRDILKCEEEIGDLQVIRKVGEEFERYGGDQTIRREVRCVY